MDMNVKNNIAKAYERVLSRMNKESEGSEGYPGIAHDLETLRAALISLVAVSSRYLPDYDEHPEIQKANAALEQVNTLFIKPT